VWVADKELPAPEEVVSAQIGAPHYVGDVRNPFALAQPPDCVV